MKKLISLILCGLLLFSLAACEKNQDEITISEGDTTSETTPKTTLNTTVITNESTEKTTSDISDQTNIYFGKWTISQQFYQDKYTIIDVINNNVLYYTCGSLNVYNIMEETNYEINFDLSYYHVYYSDNSYLYGFHEKYLKENIENEDLPNLTLEFIKYNYKENKGETYTANLGNAAQDFGYIEYYNGFTYISGAGSAINGVIKVDENGNVKYLPIINFNFINHNLFVYNNKLYLHPDEDSPNQQNDYYGVYEITDDDKYTELQNGLELIHKYNSSQICFEKYILDKQYTIYNDDDTLFIKNMFNDKTTNILTNLFCQQLHGIKINDNKHYIVVRDDKINIYIIEKKRL